MWNEVIESTFCCPNTLSSMLLGLHLLRCWVSMQRRQMLSTNQVKFEQCHVAILHSFLPCKQYYLLKFLLNSKNILMDRMEFQNKWWLYSGYVWNFQCDSNFVDYNNNMGFHRGGTKMVWLERVIASLCCPCPQLYLVASHILGMSIAKVDDVE